MQGCHTGKERGLGWTSSDGGGIKSPVRLASAVFICLRHLNRLFLNQVWKMKANKIIDDDGDDDDDDDNDDDNNKLEKLINKDS